MRTVWMPRGQTIGSLKKAKRLLAFGLSLLLALYSGLSSLPVGENLLIAKNFDSFVASGRATAEGKDPYGAYDLTLRGHWDGESFDAVNLNPPISVLLFRPLADIDPITAYQLWYGFSLSAYFGMLYLLWRTYRSHTTPPRIAWALAPAGLWFTLWDGEIYVLIWGSCIGAWLLLHKNHPLAAGILIGLAIAIKPQFLVWPALLWLARHRVTSVAAIVTAFLLNLLPAYLYGPSIFSAWLRVLPTSAWLAQPDNASLAGLTARYGSVLPGTLAAVALVSALALWVWRRQPSPLRVSEFALIASLLASPIAWVGYTVVLLPVFLARTRWTIPLTIAAALLLFPNHLVWGLSTKSMTYLVMFGSLYNLALLLALVALVVDTMPPPRDEYAPYLAAAERPL